MVAHVVSPQCVLPKKAVVALDQADVDAILLEGAFAEMAHLPVAAVLGQAWGYAEALLEGQREGASSLLADATTTHGLLDLGLLPEDARFVSQVLALRDVAAHHGIDRDPDAAEGLSLGEVAEASVRLLLERVEAWKASPGRPSDGFRITRDDLGRLWPLGMMPAGHAPAADAAPDLHCVFVAIPLVAPFLVHEDDCLIESRLV